MRSSRWAMVMVGVIAILVVATMVRASPLARPPAHPLDPRFVNDDRQETIKARVAGPLLTVNNTSGSTKARAVYGRTATGSAILGKSPKGLGLYGYTKNGYGVVGRDAGAAQGRGYGGYFTSNTGVGVYGYSSAEAHYTNVYTPGVYGRSKNGTGVIGWSEGSDSWRGAGVFGYSYGGPGGKFVTWNGDNIIVAYEEQLRPLAQLDIRFRVERSGNVYADGPFNTFGADFAEMMATSEGVTYEPGDLLVIGPDGKPLPSSAPNATNLLGVYSTQPGFVGGVGDDGDTTGKIPVAITGIVPVKASAENGAISPGDLLTSSSIPGHAMKASPVTINGMTLHLPGTILGKALEPLEEGTGVISALVTLQ